MLGPIVEKISELGTLRVVCAVAVLAVGTVAAHTLYNYFRDPFDLRKFPAPSCAAFTNAWSAYHSRRLRRSRAYYDAHQRLGPIIRVQPRHISFADTRAVQDIYGHRSPIIKDTFYETISGGEFENIVSTRDKDEHARKRRYISNIFSQRNVVAMEPMMAQKVGYLINRLDRAAEENEVIDIRQWLNFFTFDVICAMAFSSDPGFLLSGQPVAAAESLDGKSHYTIDPITAFQDSTVHVASIGHWARLLKYTKPLTNWFHYNRQGDRFTDVCIYQIRQRLEKGKSDASFADFFQHFITDRSGKPTNMPFGELLQEAAVLLSAGSDTTASAMTNTLYLLLKHPEALAKLREEIQKVCPDEDLMFQKGVLPYSTVSPLKYLRACLNEGLRHLPPTSVGLLRQTPPEGARIAGHWIKGGVTVTVPTYTLQHDPKLFSDPWTFKPERWVDGSEEEKDNLRKYVIPFTLGRHSCIGRNIAFLEQYLVLSSLLNRYEFEFAEEGFELAVLERINANPGPMPVRVKRRSA